MFQIDKNTPKLKINKSILQSIDPYSFRSFDDLIKDKFKMKKDFIIARVFEKDINKNTEKEYFFKAELLNKSYFYNQFYPFYATKNPRVLNPINNFYPISFINYYTILYNENTEKKEYEGHFIGTDKDFTVSCNLRLYFTENSDDKMAVFLQSYIFEKKREHNLSFLKFFSFCINIISHIINFISHPLFIISSVISILYALYSFFLKPDIEKSEIQCTGLWFIFLLFIVFSIFSDLYFSLVV